MGDARTDNERLLETFLDLVRIDSPSRYEAACASYCARRLEAVGCVVEVDGSADVTGSDTGNLIARLKGTAPGTLVLSAHMDVVQPCIGVDPVVVDGVVVSKGDTVLGSDDKAGIAAAIETVERVVAAGGEYPSITCVFTVQEEIGLTGAKHLSPDVVAGDLCLVLDAAGTPGGIVVGAPTHWIYRAVIRGRSSHAGVEPEKGVSAIQIAAEAIAAMPDGRLDAHTTANVGTVSGGTATNVVAAELLITGECRSLDRATADEVKEAIDSAINDATRRRGGTCEIEWDLQYEGFTLDEGDEAVATVVRACSDVGLTSSTYTTGGGSDANIIAAMGVTPVVALACGMEGVHGTDEQIFVKDLEDLTSLCVAIAHRLAR